MIVCPYSSVRVFSGEQIHYLLPYPTGEGAAFHLPNTVEKCTFCAHLLAEGLQPACVEVCPLEARFFGDLSDPAGKIAELLRTRPHFQLLPDKGTQPSVYFLS
jgi:molybdopterin-containing oxidoreductase family iron-sulfur binding subunit